IKSEATESADYRSSNQESVNARRWCRRIGAQEHRLHDMVRLRSQFAQLLCDSGLWNRSGSTVRKAIDLNQKRGLNSARRTERLKTKRRRLLTLQDGDDFPHLVGFSDALNISAPKSHLCLDPDP
ncbi:unnamed protein product, partial [Echinostoma caproni]|uniref:Transposase n=1 Tax=Echinostoma caproni TaxID=27848 RepID=A0A183A2V4_9TREM